LTKNWSTNSLHKIKKYATIAKLSYVFLNEKKRKIGLTVSFENLLRNRPKEHLFLFKEEKYMVQSKRL